MLQISAKAVLSSDTENIMSSAVLIMRCMPCAFLPQNSVALMLWHLYQA